MYTTSSRVPGFVGIIVTQPGRAPAHGSGRGVKSSGMVRGLGLRFVLGLKVWGLGFGV